MFKHVLGLLSISVSISLVMISCEKSERGELVSVSLETKQLPSEAATVLGLEARDPYKFSNMYDAAQRIPQFPISLLVPTDYYVRILVDSSGWYNELLADSSIYWSSYPMEYEIIKPGTYYVGNMGDDSLYGVVPAGYVIPFGVVYDTIYPVFIPEHIDLYDRYEEVLATLEDESMKMVCGEDPMQEIGVSTKVSKWTPKVSVKIWDERLREYTPLQGVRVVVKRGLYNHVGVTNANGECVFPKYRYLVNYKIEWERNDWQIINEIGKKTYEESPLIRSQWNVKLDEDDTMSYMRGVVHRAANYAFFGSLWTIRRPVGSVLGVHKKQRIMIHENPNEDGAFGKAVKSSLLDSKTNIEIWIMDPNHIIRTAREVFATTIHEFAHLSHQYLVGNDYYHSPLINESWADCVEWYIMTNLFPDVYVNAVNGHDGGNQSWLPTYPVPSVRYSPLFIDLIDNVNQGLNDSYRPYDEISGYSLSQVEKVLKNSYDRNSLLASMCANLHGTADTSKIEQYLSIFSQELFSR